MKIKWPEQFAGWKEALGKYRCALLVILAGAVLLLLPTGGGEKKETRQEKEAETFDVSAFEEKLAGVLSRVEGAGEVRVVLTLDSGSRRVLAQDREQDREGGGSSTVVTVGSGSGTQAVVPLQTISPSFRGALVVCPGGGDARVVLALTRAVSALTGLGSDRIAVCTSG